MQLNETLPKKYDFLSSFPLEILQNSSLEKASQILIQMIG
jgi:hypothetical protein